MTDSRDATPDFKDRTVGLVVFGAVAVLIGVFCALFVPLTFLSLTLSQSAVDGGADPRSAWAAAGIYGLMAIAFFWLGAGSIRARRWACELLLSVSWIWLLTGICTLLISVLLVPILMGELASISAMPPQWVTLGIVVALGVVGLLYVVLPGLFVLFYRSPHVAATCRARDPKPHWIDACPRQLLTLAVVWALFAISVLLMPAYDFVFPLFGFTMRGVAGAALWFLVFIVCGALVVGTFRRAPWAWWGGVALTLAAAGSSTIWVLVNDLEEILALLGFPEEQVATAAAFGVGNGWLMALINALAWGTFLVYLMSLRAYFESILINTDA